MPVLTWRYDPVGVVDFGIEVKDGASCTGGDFWYSLFDGGYVRPTDLLSKGVDQVKGAVRILRAFRSALEDADAIEEM